MTRAERLPTLPAPVPRHRRRAGAAAAREDQGDGAPQDDPPTPPIEAAQFQPASLDLRLGKEAYRVRASFLPGRGRTVAEQLAEPRRSNEIADGDGAVLETGCVYVVAADRAPRAAAEHLRPSPIRRARPAGSTFSPASSSTAARRSTRSPLGYTGPLFAEISPRSFSVRVREGSRLNQIRFRRRIRSSCEPTDFACRDDDMRELPCRDAARRRRAWTCAKALDLRVALGGAEPARSVGYRAQEHADVIDVDRVGAYAAEDFWEPIHARADRRLILDPDEFYILASREKTADPVRSRRRNGADRSGDRRVPRPLRRLLRSGLRRTARTGARRRGRCSKCAATTCRFLLEDGQVGRPARLREARRRAATSSTARTIDSNYQGQGLKLSKRTRKEGNAGMEIR